MKLTGNTLVKVFLIFVLVISGSQLIACSSSTQESSSESDISAEEAVLDEIDTSWVTGEIVNLKSCSVLLPNGWQNDGRFLYEGAADESNNRVEVMRSLEGQTESSLNYEFKQLVSQRNPKAQTNETIETVRLGGVDFRAFEDQSFPSYHLMALKDSCILELTVWGLDFDNPILHAIVESIGPKVEGIPDPLYDNQESQTPQATGSTIEDGLPLTMTVFGQDYTIRNIIWESIDYHIAIRDYYGIKLQCDEIKVEEVFPFDCEVVFNGETVEHYLTLNRRGYAEFAFDVGGVQNKPALVRIWAADDPSNVHEFVLK